MENDKPKTMMELFPAEQLKRMILWPFGTAYKRPGSTQYTYEYDPEAVIRYVAARDAMRGGGNEKREFIPRAGD